MYGKAIPMIVTPAKAGARLIRTFIGMNQARQAVRECIVDLRKPSPGLRRGDGLGDE
ncbi:MAG: hypothetical protein GYA66_01280 [Phyllobacteriaceae bacterium]|nr:hypothetical protein [Phyllobacteriaceae bacterium]